jgi:pimeloyl-ACP methyl ester carboxylesterase
VTIFKILPALLALPLLLAAGSASAAAPAMTDRSCHLPGVVEALRCVSVTVPLDHAKPQGPTLALHVTVAPAFRQGSRTDPLFVLAGGPGQAGSDVLVLLKAAFDRVRATRDIVFIDQRGTGRSGKLGCVSKPEHETMGDAELMAELRACIAANTSPLSAYTTLAAARDLERVRLALGYGQVNLWGGSYGTRLAQTYARAYPSSVRAPALDGVFAACAKDAACHKAYPNLRAEFDGLVTRLEAGDLRLSLPNPRTAEQTSFTMSSDRFLGTVHNILYAPADARRLPFLIHNASQGRWQPFIARQNLAGDFGNDASVSMLLHFAVVCAEDVPRFTPELMKLDAAVLARPLAEMMPKLCKDDIKVPVVPYITPTRIDAPALLLSGALDPVTPPHRAASAARSMAHAQQIVVANAGHGVSQLGCAPRLLRAFLDHPQDKLDAACMAEIPAPTFQLGSAGPQP